MKPRIAERITETEFWIAEKLRELDQLDPYHDLLRFKEMFLTTGFPAALEDEFEEEFVDENEIDSDERLLSPYVSYLAKIEDTLEEIGADDETFAEPEVIDA